MQKRKKISEFAYKVYGALGKIPRGRVSCYADIAFFIKNPRSARAVGNALNKNPFAPGLPCHRVVKSDGSLGGFNGGERKKIRLLKKEGVKVSNGKIANFKKVRYKL
jgi:methylated-DNA-[protein]-cysteine S-methyltransferase